jgi:hypothetical protein
VNDLPDDFAFRLVIKSGTAREILESIVYERICCPFRFELAEQNVGGQLLESPRRDRQTDIYANLADGRFDLSD